ncbi:MAG: hypothetical protein H7A37_08135 [Chlamydiales bacterium]|nr:hypothetical protein [Chlamydiia bacterium]MCP5508249.1 hypothetical protein [Chlamydiales bacterium]
MFSSSDSIARFDTSNELFNAQRSAAQIRRDEGRSLLVVGSDTIQSAKKSPIEQEVIKKFEASGNNLPADHFVPFARAGKYLFLAVSLPSYLFLYSIPKWVALNVVPFIANKVEMGLKHGAELFNRLFAAFSNAFINPFRLASGNMNWTIQGSMEKNLSFLGYLGKGLATLGITLFHAARNTYQWTQGHVRTLFKHAQEAFGKLRQTFAQLSEKVGQRWSSASQTVSSIVRSIRESVDNSFLHPLLGKFTKRIRFFEDQTKKGREWVDGKVGKYIKRLHAKLEPYIAMANCHANRWLSWLNRMYNFLIAPIIGWIRSKFAFVMTHIANAYRWIDRLARHYLWELHLLVQRTARHAVPFLRGKLSSLSNSISRISNIIWKAIVLPLFSVFEDRYPNVAHVVKKVFLAIAEVFRFVGRAVLYIANQIKTFILWLIKHYRALFNSLIALIKMTLISPFLLVLGIVKKTIAQIARYVGNILKKIGIATLYLLAWSRVLLRYGFRLTVELAEEIISWFPTR